MKSEYHTLFLAAALLVIASTITACQPAVNSSNSTDKIAHTISTTTDGLTSQEISRKPSLPVEMFDIYCYRYASNYERIVAIAELSKLSHVPKELNPIIEAKSSTGMAFFIERSDDSERLIILGVAKVNTCSIYSSGYDRNDIQDSMREHYHLKSVMADDTGLQINAMFVPNGTTGTVLDTHINGVIGIAYPKDPKIQDITISFVPPEVTKQLFRL